MRERAERERERERERSFVQLHLLLGANEGLAARHNLTAFCHESVTQGSSKKAKNN